MQQHAAAKSLQSCPTLCDPMECSLPGSSIHGIFQATVLEWGAIAFSHVATWIDLKIIVLSEISHTEKDKYHIISLIRGIF